jgi:hypothetical protein
VRALLAWTAAVLVAMVALYASPRSALASPAPSTLHPETADADAHALLEASGYSFCTKPEHPLSPRARELCPLAGEIPGCSALVLACEDKVLEPRKLGPFWERVFAFLGRIAPYAAWVVVGALALFVLYLIVRAIVAAREDVLETEPKKPLHDVSLLRDEPAGGAATAAEALLRLAAEAARRGDGRTALVTYLAAALRALDDRGAIRLARDRTNGEYLRGCQELASRPTLRELVREVDGVQFGGTDASADVVALAASRAEAIVRVDRNGVPRLVMRALMALWVVLLVGACNGGAGGGRDDPAGRDLLSDLLTKQGAEISSLPGSLANLPMKGASGPVVILDAERVPLEDETRDHLVAWVKQGGVLVLAGDPSLWPAAFWAKRSTPDCTPGIATVKIETRRTPQQAPEGEGDDDAPASAAPQVHHAKIAASAGMTWPNEDRAPRVLAHLDSGDLYAALRVFGQGRILGLASADLLSNAGLAVPGNAAALMAMLAATDRNEFAIARSEQGIAPPSNPFSGLLHIGLGPALLHVALFIPLLFFAFGMRQTAPRKEPRLRRRAFAEHVRAVGALYARRRAASHALSVYAKYVDDRVRATMSRGANPAEFLAARAGADARETAELYARALAPRSVTAARGDELVVLQRLSSLYARALARK